MARRKRLSLAPEALEDLEEITEDQIATSKLERAKEIQQQNKRLSEHEAQAPTLQGDQLSAYIQNCVKLSQDNKITIRNAFDLQLIDYMIAFAKETKDTIDGQTNFSLASMSLDASGKIYGYRVDSVHQDVFRLISGLGGQKGGQGAEIPEAPDNVLEDGPADLAKKAKKRRIRSTYVAEESAIEGCIEIDYEICGNENLTTVHHNDGNAFGRLMSYNLIPSETESIDLEGNTHWWSQGKLESTRLSGEKKLTFQDGLPLSTYFLERDMNTTFAMNVSQLDVNRLSQGGEDPNNSVVFDLQAEPMPIAEDIAENLPNRLDMSPGHNEPHVDDVSAMHSIAGPYDSQYSIAGDFSMTYLQNFKSYGLNFAGPSQFRLKRFNILGAEKRGPGPGRQATRKKELVYLSFKEENSQYFEDAKPNVTRSKNANALSPITMDLWSSEATTLTVEFTPSSFARLAQLFTLPGISIRQNKQKATEDLGEERLIEYHDDADDRPVSPCADDHFSELGRDGENAERDFNLDNIEAVDNDFGVPQSQPIEELGYDNLISAPGIVAEKLAIAYTKAAKKFNVRQMKESYWKVLTKETNAEEMVGEKSFSELYQQVLPLLSVTNRKNLSLPLAFVSVLMLCNEKHLVLQSEKDDLDFSVRQAPNPQKDVDDE